MLPNYSRYLRGCVPGMFCEEEVTLAGVKPAHAEQHNRMQPFILAGTTLTCALGQVPYPVVRDGPSPTFDVQVVVVEAPAQLVSYQLVTKCAWHGMGAAAGELHMATHGRACRSDQRSGQE